MYAAGGSTGPNSGAVISTSPNLGQHLLELSLVLTALTVDVNIQYPQR